MSRIKVKQAKQSQQAQSAGSSSTSLAESQFSLSSYIGAVNLDKQLTLAKPAVKGTKKTTPGRRYRGTAEFLSEDNAEYLYLTNSYIARGLDTESDAIVRNGYSITPTNSSDQAEIDNIIKYNDLDLIIRDINRFIGLYGQPMLEIYHDKETKTWKFEILPPTEMDYLRDKSNNILYDKTTGEPQGYVQKRDGKDIAIWQGEDAKRIVVFKNRTLGGYIDGIPGIQSVLYPATEYGHIRSSISDSFIRSLPVCHIVIDGASPEDISEVTSAVGTKFTARTVYVTSERFNIENSMPRNDIDVFRFMEPTLSEIAAAFSMPIEMLAATEYLKADDFNDRYAEWIDHIKMRQKLIASIFERKVFNKIFPDGVSFKFNSPATLDTTELLTNVGYAVQSNAISADIALEILAKAQVFGPYTDDILKSRKSTGDVNNSVQKEEEKVVDKSEEVEE